MRRHKTPLQAADDILGGVFLAMCILSALFLAVFLGLI